MTMTDHGTPTDTPPGSASSSVAPPAKRRKHLIDPNAPRPVRDVAREQRSLSRVQRWVMSTLAVSTILHMSLALIVLTLLYEDAPLSSQIGLNVIAGAFGVLAVAAGLGIHGKRIVSPWLLLGVIPGIIGIWLTLG
ncbi:hypothetical protein [Nocardioides ferulae]|uniref:hypothetical protein n=1 Tax=Nocardioides ferulae TaxID=2340821 RepID=UPI001F0C3446|nr:hypothetical protein [Nocardioides ferulae]